MRSSKQPPPLYPPQRQSIEALAREAGEAADIALASAYIAKRAAESMPKPDPREDVNYQRLSGLEQSFRGAHLAPPQPLAGAAGDRRAPGGARPAPERSHRHARRPPRSARACRAEYADALAAWMAAGEVGPKPVSEARALEEAIAEAEADHAAIDNLRTRVLEERIAFVERHRKRLVRDAEREAEQAKARYLEAVDMLAQAREDLVGLRETTVWALLYPSETLASFAPSHALAGGRRRETEQHLPGVRGELPAHAVLALLRADAEYFATVSTVEQAAAMQGVTAAELTTREAMWAGSGADIARQKREKEQLIAAGGRTTVDALKLLEAQRFGR